MMPLRSIAIATLTLCLAHGVKADSFKCGAEALNAAAAMPQPSAEAKAAAPSKPCELEQVLEEIAKDEFPNDKARDVALAKAKSMLADAEFRLPADVASPAKVLQNLADAASLPEVAYSVLLQRENASIFASRDTDSLRNWLYGTAAGIQPGMRGEWDNFELSPVPDKRVSFVEATKTTANGEIRSSWKFEADKCNWSFTIPEGSKATVCVNGLCTRYEAGEHQIEIKKTVQ